MHSVVKMLLKGEVGGCALNSHGNYIVDHGKWKNHGIVFLNFCWNPIYIQWTDKPRNCDKLAESNAVKLIRLF